MATWADFMDEGGSIAAIAAAKLTDRVAYLATVRQDGSPRVHPITPRVYGGRLFVRMHPSSPKAQDLRTEPRFAVHSQVDDADGTGGEIILFGRAILREENDSWTRSALAGLPDLGPTVYPVFELGIDEIRVTLYEDDKPVHKRWPRRFREESVSVAPSE